MKIPADPEGHSNCLFATDYPQAGVSKAPVTIVDEVHEIKAALSSGSSSRSKVSWVLALFFPVFQTKSLGVPSVGRSCIFLFREIFQYRRLYLLLGGLRGR